MRPLIPLCLLAVTLPSLARGEEPTLPISAPELFTRAMLMSLEEEVRLTVPPRPRPPMPRSYELGGLIGIGDLDLPTRDPVEATSYGFEANVHWRFSRYVEAGPAIVYTHWSGSQIFASGWTLAAEGQVRVSYPGGYEPFVQLAGGVAYASTSSSGSGFGSDRIAGGSSTGLVYGITGGVAVHTTKDNAFLVTISLRRADLRHDVLHADPQTGEEQVVSGPIELAVTAFGFGFARNF